MQTLVETAFRTTEYAISQTGLRCIRMVACDIPNAMRSVVRTLFPVLLLLLASLAVADDPDFSGSYKLTGGNRRLDARKSLVVTLNVIQTTTEVEVTMVKDGQSTANKFMLDGKEGVYNTLRGPNGKCKGRLRGKNLTLDAFITLYPDNPTMTMLAHLREIWELSSDLKKLTIRGEEELLKAPPNVVLPSHIPPWTEIYARD
jgi:hypothetical protein